MKATLTIALLLAFAPVLRGSAEARAGQPTLDVRNLIAQLREQPWPGASVIAEGPLQWEFHLTEPMRQVLAVGPAAQLELLRCLDDPTILDQVIFLLGGVGDERAVGPIINAIQRAVTTAPDERQERIVTAGNLALTNITAAEVIWHHGGGIVLDRCPEQPAQCWAVWWARNGSMFRAAAIEQHRRNYSNYPNYGIYANVADSRKQAF
jgi:hypothetical protein